MPSDVVSRARGAEGPQPIDALNIALDRLNSGLDRLIDAVKQSADDYALAADRLERQA